MKKIILLAILAANSVSAQPLMEFNFNEGTGTTVASADGRLVGTFVGTPTFINDSPSTLPGDFALQFAAGQRVTVPDPTKILALDTAARSFTIQAWLKFTTPSARSVFFYNNGPGGAVSASVFTDRTAYVTTLGVKDQQSAAAIPDDGAWHHMAVVHENGKEIRFYIDGVLSDTQPYTGSVIFTRTNQVFYIGAESTGGLQYVGLLDRLRYSKGILTPAQLDSNFVPDTSAPKVLGASALKKGTAIEIGVGFAEPVDEASASNVANYSLSTGTVTGVRFQKYITAGAGPGSGASRSPKSAVVLTTTGLTSPGAVTLTVRNVKDLQNNAISAEGVTAQVNLSMSWVGVGGNEYVDGGDPASQWPDDAVAYSNKDFDLVSGGSAHWDGYDELTFVYESITGDFDKKVRVEYQDPSSQWARAGLMIREALDEGVTRAQLFDQPDGANNPNGVKMSQVFTTRVNPAIGHIIDPAGDPADSANRSPANNSYEVIHRPRAGFRYGGTGEGVDAAFNIASGFGTAPPYPNAWIRIRRVGQQLTTWRSADGVNWLGGANVTYTDISGTTEVETLADTLFVGPFYAPEFGNNSARTEVGHSVHAKFREYGDTVPATAITTPKITSITLSGNSVTIVWTGGGTLQSAPTLSASPIAWTNIAGATTGTYTAPIGAATQLYFRVSK